MAEPAQGLAGVTALVKSRPGLFPSNYASLPGFLTQAKEHSMKNMIRLILLAAALLGLSATTALADGGGPSPTCFPGDAGCPK